MGQMECIIIVTRAILALKPQWNYEETKKEYSEVICEEAEKRNIDPLIGIALAQHETGFNKNLVYYNKNRSVDYGLMQFNCERHNTISWRRYWCSRTRELRTARGNIKAGFQELEFWRDHSIKLNGENNTFLFNITQDTDPDFLFTKIGSASRMNFSIYQTNFDTLFTTKFYGYRTCNDCFNRNIFAKKITDFEVEHIGKRYWWVRHYNFNSPYYSYGVLYVYKVLLEEREELYPVIRQSLHRRFMRGGWIVSCIKRKDMCLQHIPKGFLQ